MLKHEQTRLQNIFSVCTTYTTTFKRAIPYLQELNIRMSQIHVIRKFPGQFAPGNESSREREGQGAKGPGNESSTERKFHGAKVPGSELARVLLADSPQGANWPGSEKAVNPKTFGFGRMLYADVECVVEMGQSSAKI